MQSSGLGYSNTANVHQWSVKPYKSNYDEIFYENFQNVSKDTDRFL